MVGNRVVFVKAIHVSDDFLHLHLIQSRSIPPSCNGSTKKFNKVETLGHIEKN